MLISESFWVIAVTLISFLEISAFLLVTAKGCYSQPVERRNHEQAYRIDRFGKG